MSGGKIPVTINTLIGETRREASGVRGEERGVKGEEKLIFLGTLRSMRSIITFVSFVPSWCNSLFSNVAFLSSWVQVQTVQAVQRLRSVQPIVSRSLFKRFELLERFERIERPSLLSIACASPQRLQYSKSFFARSALIAPLRSTNTAGWSWFASNSM